MGKDKMEKKEDAQSETSEKSLEAVGHEDSGTGALVKWAEKNLDEEDWVREKNGQWLLRLDAAERMARDFQFSVEDEAERPMEFRPSQEWPSGIPVACVFVTMVAQDGRRAIRGGKYAGSEADLVDGKPDPEQLTDHYLLAMAHSRAFRMCVRQLVGGFSAIEPKDGPAVVEPRSVRPPSQQKAVPTVERIHVSTNRSEYEKGGGNYAGDYYPETRTFVRRGFREDRHVLRIDKTVGMQASVAQYLLNHPNGRCKTVVLECPNQDAVVEPSYRRADFFRFVLAALPRMMNSADGLQLFAPVVLFEEVARDKSWAAQGIVTKDVRLQLASSPDNTSWWEEN